MRLTLAEERYLEELWAAAMERPLRTKGPRVIVVAVREPKDRKRREKGFYRPRLDAAVDRAVERLGRGGYRVRDLRYEVGGGRVNSALLIAEPGKAVRVPESEPRPTSRYLHEPTARGCAHNAAKTHCKRGHPFDEANTYIRKDGSRFCRACERENKRRSWERKKVERLTGESATYPNRDERGRFKRTDKVG